VNATNYLARERELAEQLLPGLDKALSEVPLGDLEVRGGPGLDFFKTAGGPGLLAPHKCGGVGADPLDAVLVQRAVAARSPSLAVATMMHHLSVASFAEFLEANCPPEAPEWELLGMVAGAQMLVASASAEGKTKQSVLAPTLRARWDGEVWRVTGSKKPCSLAGSLDLLTASVLLEGDHPAAGTVSMALVLAGTEGMSSRPFWKAQLLAGAESDEVVLTDVAVPDDLMVHSGVTPGTGMDEVQVRGWTWFELLATASYLGVVSGLVERALAAGAADQLGEVHVAVESGALALEAVARSLREVSPRDALGRALLVRFHVQDLVVATGAEVTAILGGLAFIQDPDVSYLLGCTRALAFHPPSRRKAVPALAAFVAGDGFDTAVF